MNLFEGLVVGWRAKLRMLLRYGAVSAVSTATGLSVIAILVGLFKAPAGWANVAATALGTVPSFELNRRWVWSQSGRRSVLRQVVPFSALALSGLGLSTLTVHIAGLWTTAWGWGRLATPGGPGAAPRGQERQRGSLRHGRRPRHGGDHRLDQTAPLSPSRPPTAPRSRS